MANIVTSKTRNLTGSKHAAQGKGTWRRPAEVDAKTYAENWERTFGKKDKGTKQRKKGGANGA